MAGHEEKPDAGFIRLGDLVYFSVPALAGGEDLIWTSSSEQVPNFQLVARSKVETPALSLFWIRPFGQESIGDVVKPDTPLKLLHDVTNAYVVVDPNPVTFQLRLNENSASELAFRISTPRTRIEEGVKDLDDVSILTLPKESPFCLSKDFWFVGGTAETFRINRFERQSEELGIVRYGKPCKLKWERMYLSVKPNFSKSSLLVIKEDEQTADFLSNPDALYFPEYQGELKVELSSDADEGNNYWLLEKPDPFSGGEVKSGEEFFLKHVASGKYLSKDMTVVRKSEAKPWFFPHSSESQELVSYGSLYNLVTSDACIVSFDHSPSLDALKTHLFQPTQAESSSVVFHLPLTDRPTTGQIVTIKFSCEAAKIEDAKVVLTLSQYCHSLPKLRLTLQNITKLPDIRAALDALNDSLSLRLNFSTAKEAFQANLASDFQIVSELLRIWILRELGKNKYENEFKNIGILVQMGGRLQNLQFFERVCSGIFAKREMIIRMAGVAYAILADILQWALKSHAPTEPQRMFWSEVYLFQPLPMNTYPEFVSVNFFCHYLLDRLPSKMSFRDLHGLKRDDHFILRFEKEQEEYVVTTFGSIRSLSEVINQMGGFAATTIELAAELCVHSEFKSEIIKGMGLDQPDIVKLFSETANNIRLQMSLVFFISLVHVPDCSTYSPLSKLSSSHLLNHAVFSPAPFPDLHSNWFYFTESNSPLSDLIKYEVHFWLSTAHVSSNEEPTTWYYNTAVHLRFAAQLIDYRTVSDVFVVGLVVCAIAASRWVLGNPVPDFSERFPDLRESKFRTETEKQRFLDATLELISVYQSWKLFKVIQHLSLSGLESISAEDIVAAEARFSMQNVLLRYCESNQIPVVGDVSGREDDLPLLARKLKALLDNPDLSVGSMLSYLVNTVQFRGRGNPSFLQDLLTHEIHFPDWITEYLGQLYDEGPYQPYLTYLQAIDRRVLSLIELERVPGILIRNLGEYISAMESLYEFMLNLKEENLSRFQLFLNKANFLITLERMWTYSAAVKANEDPLCVELRSFTFELTRLYVQDNPIHIRDVLTFLPNFPVFLDFPQYLRLLQSLNVRFLNGEVASLATELLFEAAVQDGQRKRFLFSLALLLEDQTHLSQSLFRLRNRYMKLQKDQLSVMEWELLITMANAVPPDLRVKCFGEVMAKWYESDGNQIRREGAAVVIYTANTTSEVFHAGLRATVSHIMQINNKPGDVISDRLKSFQTDHKTIRQRNFEGLDNDLNYVLELITRKKTGVAEQIPAWMPRITLQNIVGQVSQLYSKLDFAVAPIDITERVFAVLKKYAAETDDVLGEAEKGFLDTAVNRGPPTQEEGNQSESGVKMDEMKLLFRLT